MEQKTTIDISTKTFLKIFGIVLGLIFTYMIIDILAFIFLAFIIASAFKPAIKFLENAKIPKILGIAIVYVLFVGFLIFVIALVVRPMAYEIGQLAQVFPDYYVKIQSFFSSIGKSASPSLASNIQSGLSNVSNVLTQTVNSLFSTTIKLFGGLFSFLMIVMMAFYFSMQENVIRRFIKNLVPEKYHDYMVNLNTGVQEKIGKWFIGQLALCIGIFCLTYIGLSLMKVRYALILAILAGVFEIIPYFGPWFSGAIAVLLTLTQSPTLALFVTILYFSIQQLENLVIVPLVMGSSTGLNPLLVIIGILVGFKLGGVLGGLLAVPVIATLSVFVLEYYNRKSQYPNKIDS
ncbi:MAG TPA: AI-2E family transporter [bacterium]|nr:AI-2E family transporter [bacterium]